MTSKKTLISQFKSHILNMIQKFKPKDKKKDTIRIATFNIQMWMDCDKNNNTNQVFETIEKINADVICLQEVLSYKNKLSVEMLEKNLKNLGYKYHKMCTSIGINIIASKYEITKSSVLKLHKSPRVNRYALYCNINVNNKNIDIVTTHLDVFDESEEIRLKQITEIIDKYGNEIILLGDFNSLQKCDYTEEYWNKIINDDKKRNVISQTRVSDYLNSVDMVDCYTKINPDEQVISVWSMRRVDYIFMNKKTKYKILDCFLYPSLASDHLPMVVDIDIEK